MDEGDFLLIEVIIPPLESVVERFDAVLDSQTYR